MKKPLAELFNSPSERDPIEVFLGKTHYDNYSIKEMIDFKKAFNMPKNQEMVQKFIERKIIDLMKYWTEE